MYTSRIEDDEIQPRSVSALSVRPTAPTANGGDGFTAGELKERFDALPLLLVERFNTLIDDIEAEGDDSIAGSIYTGIDEMPTLYDFFSAITNDEFSSVMTVNGETVASAVASLSARIARIERIFGIG